MQLVLDNLSKSYGKKMVLNNINYTFEKGKIYGLLGRNGAGKTTLFNIINGNISSDNGNIYLNSDGHVQKLDDDIGYVISTPNVPLFLTAREFLKFFIEVNESKIENIKTIDEYFDMVNIDVSHRDKLLKDYSHGMKNKIQMLVNFILKPSILLLDEPLTSLDVVASEEMKKIFLSIKDESILIFSTHIMELALSLCDEIIILVNGKLECIHIDGKSDEDVKNMIIEHLKEDNYDK